VVSMQDARDHLGQSKQADYIYKYIKECLGGQTSVIEEKYVDKDYFIDYAGFYARSFGNIDRCTKRVHFFSESFDRDYFEDCLIKNHENGIKNDAYLGFVVIKQFKDNFGDPDPAIGRTLLETLPKSEEGSSDNRQFIYSKYKSSLYGIPLNINTLPFQAQDHAVAACATTALWTASHQLNALFGTLKLPPIEITKRAGFIIENNRNFPNQGLTLKQMLAFLNSIDLDFEYINTAQIKENCNVKVRNIVPETIKALAPLKIPIIAVLRLITNGKPPDLHAVVISGYRQDEVGSISRIYVHDDQIGPYSRVFDDLGDGSFFKWSNEWTKDQRYGPCDDMYLDGLLIPLYPKIRLSYKEISGYVIMCREKYPEYDINLYMTTVQDYKNKLVSSNIKDKVDILRKPMPRFMWVISFKKNKNSVTDLLVDATSHIIRIRCVIMYN